MKVTIKNVRKDNCSCHFCNKGKLSDRQKSLVYPYESVFQIEGDERKMIVRLCADCLSNLIQLTGQGSPISNVKYLIEDYRRRLKTISDMIDQNTDHGSILDQKRKERLNTKAGEYRTVITELERALSI